MSITFNLYRNPNDGNKLLGAYPNGDKPSTYTPIVAYNFTGTNNDNNVVQFKNAISTKRRYSTAISGAVGNTSCLELDGVAGENGFAGSLVAPAGGWPDIVDGDTFWIRWYQYFPSSFCAGYGTTPADGWGNTKWVRVQWGEAGVDPEYSRLTLNLGNFSSSACSTGPTFKGCGFENISGTSNQWFASEQAIPKDQWVALQFAVKLGANGWLRGWIDDSFVGQVDASVLPAGAPYGVSTVVLGDYWNGSPHQNTTWYQQDFIMTKEQPTTVDSGGRPYIDPAISAEVFV